MTEDPQQVGAALAALVPSPPPRPDRFEEVRARVRRRRRITTTAAVSAAAVAVAVVAVGTHLLTRNPDGRSEPVNGPAITVTTPTDARPAIRDARLTRPLSFDTGELRLDPATATPTVSEAQALTLFRASGMPHTQTDDVVVTFADATVTIPLSTAHASVVPRELPTFNHRPVWAVLWDYNGPIYCPMMRGRQVTGPVARPVALIAADASGEGIEYTTRGTSCGAPIVGPTAGLLGYYQSLPWVIVSAAANGDATVQFTLPPCASLFGSNGPDSRGGATVLAWVALARPPCTVPRADRNTTVIPTHGQPLEHGPTGLLPGRVSHFDGAPGDAFVYFDGTTHTITGPTATATPATSAATAAPCTAAHLLVRGGRQGGAFRTAAAIVEFTNIGPAPCQLTGIPAVRILRSDGTALPVQQQVAAHADRPPVVLAPGRPAAASLALWWANWCGGTPGPLHVAVSLPDAGGTATGAFDGPPSSDVVPGCVAAGQPSTLTITSAYDPPS